jgi:uncharacterized membrane protein
MPERNSGRAIAGILETIQMKSRLGIALLGILIFLLGGIAGATSYYLYCEHQKAPVRKTILKVEDVVDWLATELRLDAKQKTEVRVIITDTRERYRALSQEFRPRYEQLRRESDDRINALLRDDQKPLFKEFLRKIREATPSSSQPASSK